MAEHPDRPNTDRFRYRLTRYWGPPMRALDNRLAVVMLNPSTADEHQDDPTIRRVIRFAKRDEFSGIQVANLFAIRSTDPREIEANVDAVGDFNDDELRDITREFSDVLIAWGAVGTPKRRARAAFVHQLLKTTTTPKPRIWCLGTTKDGHPRHPLYVKGDQALVPFNPQEYP